MSVWCTHINWEFSILTKLKVLAGKWVFHPFMHKGNYWSQKAKWCLQKCYVWSIKCGVQNQWADSWWLCQSFYAFYVSNSFCVWFFFFCQLESIKCIADFQVRWAMFPPEWLLPAPPCIHPSNYPSSTYPGVGHGGSSLSKDTQTCRSSATSSSSWPWQTILTESNTNQEQIWLAALQTKLWQDLYMD